MKIQGDLSFATVMNLRQPGYQAIESSDTNVVSFDCSQVRHSDSSSIALMIDWVRHAKALNKKVVFENMPDKMKQIFLLAQIQGLS